jgi:hypothetical protein
MIQRVTMKQATFLWKNERGIYFFRARVPKQLSEYFTCSEIKKSLRTDSYRLAVKLARAYRAELDREMAKFDRRGKDKDGLNRSGEAFLNFT